MSRPNLNSNQHHFQNDSAVARLVYALKPNDTGENFDSSMDLASRILQSQLGATTTTTTTTSSRTRDSTEQGVLWKRRLQQQQQLLLPNNYEKEYETIQKLYQELVHQTVENGDSDLLADKIMTVLTKCTGRRAQIESTSRQQQEQEQQQAQSTSYQQHTRQNFSSYTGTGLSASNTMMVDDCDSHPNNKNVPMSRAVQYEEQQVLRELLYALQGMEGERIKFYYHNEHDQVETELGPQYEGIRILSPSLQGGTTTTKQYAQSSQLGSGAMDTLRICGEAGWLVQRLQKYVDLYLNPQQHQLSTDCKERSGGGQVARALARSVAQELQSYHDCLAQWEQQHLNTWSLRQWLVQIQRHPILQRLTVLCMLTEALPSHDSGGSGVGGGTLLSALHAHSLHGDSRHKSLVQSILYPTSQPWFHMLYLWTTQGLLPASWGRDFFVTLQENYQQATHLNMQQNDRVRQGSNNNVENKHLWHDKYTMDKSQIPHPGIFDPDLVRPAFVVGKGINFIRTCLHQVGWTLQLEDEEKEGGNSTARIMKSATVEDNSAEAIMQRLGYHYVADPMGMHLNPRLTKTLLRAEKLVHSHILQSLRQDHNLMDHLFALKQFLLQGQGDFLSSLMDGLYSEFGCGIKQRDAIINTSFVAGNPVAGVYPQQLVDIMEASLRQTNAKDLPVFCLERLRVEVLPFEPGQALSEMLFSSPSRTILEGEDNEDEPEVDNRTVWDIFMLDYTVPDPLLAIVHEKALEQYKLVYSFLFSLRKVEYMLHRTWRQSATLQHELQKMAQNNGLQRSSSVGYAHATVLLRRISMTRQAMTHFCVNLKSYCMLEVLEGGWKELQENLRDARTLDEAVEAHDHYLESICRKILLSKGKKSHGRYRRSNKFEELFSVILRIATDFCVLQERLFDEALKAAERVSQRRREAEQRMTHG